jgi:hypothetical protein
MTRRDAVVLLSALVSAALLFLASCGGKARVDEGPTGRAVSVGAGGDTASPGAAAPSVVHLVGGENPVTDFQAKPECLQGFQGFSAKLAEQFVDFKAFVFEPGDYTGDPVKILYLDVTGADGHYQAATGTGESTGSINLHVDAVDPRFAGYLEAVLTEVDDPMKPNLRMRLDFDIAVRDGCN